MKKHKILFKIFFWILIIISIIAISYILLDYKSQSYDLASVYNSVGTERQNDTSSMKKLDFIHEYTKLTGKLDLVISKGLNVDSTIGENSSDDSSNKESESGGGSSGGSDTSSDDAYIASIKVSDSDQAIIDKDITEAIQLITNGTKYNSMTDFKNFSKVESDLKNLQKNYAETITVKCWQWSSKSGSSTNYDKTTKNVNITCNKAIAPIIKSIFNDIYNLPSKPVIYSSGCWVVRKKTSSDSASAHSFGCAIDLNASSCLSNGTTYGNGYKQTIPTKAQWESLPDCQTKYEIFYEDCSVVKVFYKYGFYWGGEWKSSPDGMHFGFIGDCGNDGRKNGQRNQKK